MADSARNQPWNFPPGARARPGSGVPPIVPRSPISSSLGRQGVGQHERPPGASERRGAWAVSRTGSIRPRGEPGAEEQRECGK